MGSLYSFVVFEFWKIVHSSPFLETDSLQPHSTPPPKAPTLPLPPTPCVFLLSLVDCVTPRNSPRHSSSSVLFGGSPCFKLEAKVVKSSNFTHP